MHSTIPKAAIRVLVTDDSAVMRQLITRMLRSDPAFEVVGTARTGRHAIDQLQLLRPDLITLDIEMPELDGMAALREIKRIAPSVRTIMCSSLTERGARITLEALMHGADDYVTKQHSGEMGANAYDALCSDLLRKARQLFRTSAPAPATSVLSSPTAAPASARRRPLGPIHTSNKPKILVIGVSTGGPSALAEIMPLFPADFPIPIAIVQHMPPFFTQLLAERLTRLSRLCVLEAAQGTPLLPGQALIAPGNFHLSLIRHPAHGVIASLNQDPPENSCRPAVDVLFRSAADLFGSATMAVVLTGMGQDGLVGARALKQQNASILVQDAATSVIWGMPRAIAEARLADDVLPLRDIVPAILRSL